MAQLFPGEFPSWWRRGAHQRLAHLLVTLGLRCCWDFSYLGIGNSVQTLKGEGCGPFAVFALNTARLLPRDEEDAAPRGSLEPTSPPAHHSEQNRSQQCNPELSNLLPQGGTGWGLPLPAQLFLSPKIRLKHNPVCSVLLGGWGAAWAGFGAASGFWWPLWVDLVMGLSYSTITPSPFGSGTARWGEAKQWQARSRRGSISASGSSPPQSPLGDFGQQLKVQGLRDDAAWVFKAQRCLGLGGRWRARAKRDLLRLTDYIGRQDGHFCYFKILFPRAELCAPSGC